MSTDGARLARRMRLVQGVVAGIDFAAVVSAAWWLMTAFDLARMLLVVTVGVFLAVVTWVVYGGVLLRPDGEPVTGRAHDRHRSWAARDHLDRP